MGVQGVFFDLGGTLFTYRGIGRATAPLLMEAIQRMGIGGEPREISRTYQRASREISQEYAAVNIIQFYPDHPVVELTNGTYNHIL